VKDTDTHKRPVQQLQEHLRQVPDLNVPFLYPLEVLQAASTQGEVCHPSDSHWTGFGAYLAYQELAKHIPHLTAFSDEDVEIITKVGSGDLGDKFNPPLKALYSECVVKTPSARGVWDNGVSNRGYVGVWRNQNRDLPRGILFMDSYGWKFGRFIAESFSDLVTVHSPYFEQEAVAKYKPDVIVNLMAERFLITVPRDRHDVPAIETARQKQPGACYPDLDTVPFH